MKPTPFLSQVTPSYWIYTVFNPLFGYTCTIRDTVINGAIKEGATLAVRLQVEKGKWVEEVVNPRK
jgi:hypothetical protein